MTLKILSVSELTSAIKGLLEPNFRSISVRGEISNFKVQTSGHLYFSLKDADAQISAALFRSNAAGLARMPKDGDQIVAKGEISVYPPRGSYQIIVRELQFLGVGELLLKLHQLKAALQQRGWFDNERKRPLPKLPCRIGVVTSPTGAVIQDILNVLTRRFAGFQVILNPVKVQGEGAAAEIAQAIIDMNRFDLADVLIVGRGGGSIEDLWAFNEEIVAKAIFESKIPIISAVGHETDFTIADGVADVRAPTPSAAAELVIAEKANLLKVLDRARTQSASFFSQQIRWRRERMTALYRHPTLCQPHSLLAPSAMRLDDARQDADLSIQRRLQTARDRLNSHQQRLELLRPSMQIAQLSQKIQSFQLRLDDSIQSHLALKKRSFAPAALYLRLESPLCNAFQTKKELLGSFQSTFASLHPNNLLKKGYCILFSEKDDSIILSSRDIEPNQPFRAVLADGRISALALQIEETDGPHL
ncbi:MAG: xseA [Parachlamydiales bacterium]|nr:xseA [Parachlamydiales bacterium]